MANEISLLNKFVINHFKNDDLVNTISIVETEALDNNKENIYPLVNLDFTKTDILDDVIVMSYKITIVQARDIVPYVTDNKLLTNVNLIDNLNETHTVAQRFINVLSKQNNEDNIEIDTLSDITLLKDWRTGLDGVQFDIDLTIPNLGTSC